MDYVKVNDIDMIIVYKNDRIHRSLYNLLAMIYELQEHEVALVSVTEMFDTSTPQGMLFLQMLGSFAEFERDVYKRQAYTWLKRIFATIANSKSLLIESCM